MGGSTGEGIAKKVKEKMGERKGLERRGKESNGIGKKMGSLSSWRGDITETTKGLEGTERSHKAPFGGKRSKYSGRGLVVTRKSRGRPKLRQKDDGSQVGE